MGSAYGASGDRRDERESRPPECSHAPGRAFPNPLVREMLRAFGILTCPECGQALAILGRRRG